MVLVHHEVAHLEVAEIGEEAARAPAAAAVEVDLLGEDVAVGQHAHGHVRQLEARADHAHAHVDAGPFADGEAVLAQDVLEAFRAAGRAQQQHRRRVAAAQVRGQRAQVARVAAHRPAGDVEPARVEVHFAQVERGGARDPFLERGRRHQRLLHGQGQGVLAPGALLLRTLVEGFRLRGHRVWIQHGHRPARQDVPGRHRRPRHERQQLRQLLAGQAPAQPLQQRGQLADARETVGQDPLQGVEHGARREGVGEREQLQSFEQPRGALRLGIERAQALHGVAQERDAHGRLAVGREHVEDAAAARHLSRRAHRVLAAVASLVEGLEQDLRREVLARLHRDHARLEQARREDRTQQPGRGSDQRAEPAAQRGMHGRGAAQRGLGMARQAAEGRGAGGGERDHGAGRARGQRQRAQVVGQALDLALRARHHEQRRARGQQGDEQARGTGEAVEGQRALGREPAARLHQHRRGGDRRDPRRHAGGIGRGGQRRRAHGFRMRATIAVVERPGSSSTRATRPPAASTSSRPTIASSAQSAPLTSTSGFRAAMTSRGVSSS